MRQIHTEIEIAAGADCVWEVLTEFAAYPDWNPTIRRASGRVFPGEALDLHIVVFGLVGLSLRATVRIADAGHELAWAGCLFSPGFFRAEHFFRIDPLGCERVRFVQWEKYEGAVAPLLAPFLGPTNRVAFQKMNRALKLRAERFSSDRKRVCSL